MTKNSNIMVKVKSLSEFENKETLLFVDDEFVVVFVGMVEFWPTIKYLSLLVSPAPWKICAE